MENLNFDIFKHALIKKPNIGDYVLIPNDGIFKVIDCVFEKKYASINEKLGYKTYFYDDDEIENLDDSNFVIIIDREYQPLFYINDESLLIVLDEYAVNIINDKIPYDVMDNICSYANIKHCNVFHNRNKEIDNTILELFNAYINGIGTNDLSKTLRRNNYKVLYKDNKGFRYIQLKNNDIWKCKRIKTRNDRRKNFTKKNKEEEYLYYRKHTFNFIERVLL